jgi:hypothetical protein
MLPPALTSCIRRHGSAISDSYDSVLSSSEGPDGYADELLCL